MFNKDNILLLEFLTDLLRLLAHKTIVVCTDVLIKQPQTFFYIFLQGSKAHTPQPTNQAYFLQDDSKSTAF